MLGQPTIRSWEPQELSVLDFMGNFKNQEYTTFRDFLIGTAGCL